MVKIQVLVSESPSSNSGSASSFSLSYHIRDNHGIHFTGRLQLLDDIIYGKCFNSSYSRCSKDSLTLEYSRTQYKATSTITLLMVLRLWEGSLCIQKPKNSEGNKA